MIPARFCEVSGRILSPWIDRQLVERACDPQQERRFRTPGEFPRLLAALFGLFLEHHGTHSRLAAPLSRTRRADTYSTVLDESRVTDVTTGFARNMRVGAEFRFSRSFAANRARGPLGAAQLKSC